MLIMGFYVLIIVLVRFTGVKNWDFPILKIEISINGDFINPKLGLVTLKFSAGNIKVNAFDLHNRTIQ